MSNERPCLSRPWLWPHLLSLEAPAVAVGWTWALAQLHGLHLTPAVLPGLGLVVWVIYLLDRLFDTWGVPEALLDRRHRFYRRYRWPLLLLGVLPGAVAAAWLALWHLPAGLLLEAVTLTPLMAAYLVVYASAGLRERRLAFQAGLFVLLLAVHALPFDRGFQIVATALAFGLFFLVWKTTLLDRLRGLMRKEAAAGLLFALGCTAHARFQQPAGLLPWLEMLLLALLFTANLSLILQIEAPPPQRRGQWPNLVLALLLALGLGFSGFAGDSRPLASLALLVVAGLLLMGLLWRFGQRLEADAFRVFADLALLLPLLALLLG